MYCLQPEDPDQPQIPIKGSTFTIGSDMSNQLALEDSQVSARHARLVYEGQTLVIEDSHSDSGTFVNGQRVTSRPVQEGDQLLIGPYRFQVVCATASQPYWTLQTKGNWLPDATFNLSQETNVVGRGKHCQVSLPRTHLAKEHAKLIPIEAGLLVKDLGSSSGTYINNQRVQEAIAMAGDELRVDIYRFTVIPPSQPAAKAAKPRFSLEKLLTPVERKTPSNQVKQWKTAPTSPGNRIEPAKPREQRWALTISALVLVAALGLLIYLFF